MAHNLASWGFQIVDQAEVMAEDIHIPLDIVNWDEEFLLRDNLMLGREREKKKKN